MTVVIDDRCTACGACLATCPERALVPSPRRPLVIDARCTGCLACIEVCPRDAVTELPLAGPVTPTSVLGGRAVTGCRREAVVAG